MNAYKQRYNPFSHSYEVLEFDDETRFWKVKHSFEEQHDAVNCERRLKSHKRLFREEEVV